MDCLRDHDQGADLLIGYLEDTLTVEQRREIDDHALGCTDCRELLAVQAMLDEFPAPEVSADFDARLFARLAEEDAKPAWWERMGSWLWRPAIPLAAAAAVVVGMVWMRPGAEPVEDAPKQASILQEIDAQELEQALQDLELLMPPADEM
jgi:hypothetical protein